MPLGATLDLGSHDHITKTDILKRSLATKLIGFSLGQA